MNPKTLNPRYLATALAGLSRAMPGKLAPRVGAALPPHSQAALLGFLTMGGLSLA